MKRGFPFIVLAISILALLASLVTACGPEATTPAPTPTPTKTPQYIYVVFWKQPAETTELKGMTFITEFAQHTNCYGDGICYRVHFSGTPSKDELLEFAFANLKKRYPNLPVQQYVLGVNNPNPELWLIRMPLESIVATPIATTSK